MKIRIFFALTVAVAVSAYAQLTRDDLPPPRHWSGTVRYPSGEPAPGVSVEFYPGHYPGAGDYTEVKTDANGRYEIVEQEHLRIFHGEFILSNVVMARDVDKNLAAAEEFEITKTNVDLVLQPAITLSGSVKDTEGAPIPGIELDLGFSASFYRKLEAQLTKVNELGEFSIAALPQGREYKVYDVSAKGYGSGEAVVGAGDTLTNHYEFPAFVLKRANLKIAGQVFDAAGKPLAGAQIMFSGKGQPVKWGRQQMGYTKTDSEGKFSFDTICDAPLRINAFNSIPPMNLNGGSGMPAKPGDTNIVIRFPATN